MMVVHRRTLLPSLVLCLILVTSIAFEYTTEPSALHREEEDFVETSKPPSALRGGLGGRGVLENFNVDKEGDTSSMEATTGSQFLLLQGSRKRRNGGATYGDGTTKTGAKAKTYPDDVCELISPPGLTATAPGTTAPPGTTTTTTAPGDDTGHRVKMKKKAEYLLIYALKTAREVYLEHDLSGEIQASTSICLGIVGWTSTASAEVDHTTSDLNKKKKQGNKQSTQAQGNAAVDYSAYISEKVKGMVKAAIKHSLDDLSQRSTAWVESGVIVDDTTISSVSIMSAGWAEVEFSFSVNSIQELSQLFKQKKS